MERYVVTTREEYDLCLTKGIEPMYNRHFEMEPSLRKAIQEEKFGKGNKEENNIRFYRYCWKWAKHYCEECGRPLYDYSSVYISHILSRGAHAECAYDMRNFNVLCKEHHDMWENPLTRADMRIYKKNQYKINRIKKDYGIE